MGSQRPPPRSINQVLAEMYGTDLVNAKRVINTKLSKTKPNPENLTLAERILLNRRKGPQTVENSRRNSPSGSVDISDITNQNDERRTPTPEPTTNNRSPVKRQESNRSIKTIASEQPGPSNRKSSTPPLPPIKTATPRPETNTDTPRHSRSQSKNKNESRRETPVLPPIARKDSRASRVSIREEGIHPPKDLREFDPNLGVGNVEESSTPQLQNATESQSKKKQDTIEQNQEFKPKSSDTKPKTPEKLVAEKSPEKIRPKSPEKQMSPEKANVVPIVAAAATSSQRQRSHSRSSSRQRSRSKSRSRSRSRSHKHSKRKSRSRSYSKSRRRSRRSRSRKRHRSSSSYSSSTSPRRGRRHSYSPIRRHRSRGRSRSRRGSFDYDFERAKSIVRSLSRMDTFTRPRHRSPSIEYQILGGNGGFWPPARPESSKKKKKIIIVQGGGSVMQTKRRSRSSSDSDISVVVKNVKSKSRGKKEKIRRASESDETESDSSRSRSRTRRGKKKRHSKSKRNDSTSDESDEEEITIKKNSKNTAKKKKQSGKEETKKKSLRFDLRNVSSKKRIEKGTKKVSVESDNESEPEDDENVNIPKSVKSTKPVIKSDENVTPVEEKREDVASSEFRMPTPDLPLPPESSPIQRKETPFSLKPIKSPNTGISKNKNNETKSKQKNKKHEDEDLLKALDQLDKHNDFELEQIKGGNQRKLPPEVNLDMKKKIFSKEFQQNINNFLES